jgi:hypothetical protein
VHPYEDGNGRVARAIGDRALAQDEGSSERFYSLASELRRDRADSYRILEATQRGDGDVTAWLAWFVERVGRATIAAEDTTARTVARAASWQRVGVDLTVRQRAVLERVTSGFVGHLTAKTWAALGGCSLATAQRDLAELVSRGVLIRNPGGSKNTSYRLASLDEEDRVGRWSGAPGPRRSHQPEPGENVDQWTIRHRFHQHGQNGPDDQGRTWRRLLRNLRSAGPASSLAAKF